MNENKKVPQSTEDMFRFIDSNSISSEKIVAPRYSYWKSVFRVFFRKKTNIFLIAAFVIMLLVAFIMPSFWIYDPNENVTNAATFNLNPKQAMAYFHDGTLKWILGTGALGNSIFYGIVASAKTSLLLAIICAAINMSIGIVLGAVWGYSKKLDAVMLVIYQIIANVPYILLISVLVYVIGSGFWSFIFALTVTGWLPIAYFFRTQVMVIRDREYSLASRCLGTPVRRVISKNILPFLTSVIVTLLATELPSYINMEVFLSYIGVGLSASVPSLGRMIQQGQTAFMTFPHAFWPPVAVAAAITIILYLLGQNLADASDPRTHM
ncbi:MAG: ABC transporter permease [Oscillospiraceae bacterium]|jgi:ABC-type dipeptide/oligopeptide/nickel transport systems, permease components|nr:ABC transporter permease [Oscillospiraceae bacterium]